ncbi:hypothetical protein DFH08DRAFT_828432 [Mycena albidolilacea]|uniref:CxC1-like cysteine cluster associated with KDZ transposases domain-containing protein n=1 Tax=Mycena albidolilacea TaxID=1033008 RepID=A0AAD6YW35_9AGAR|nr:hypothetical protein DFH08DRAFT_828432 [Mycena albidolilacea]
MKIPAKARHTAATSSPSYSLADGPRVPNARRKFPDHIAQRPEVLLYNGRTLVQPRMPALLAQYGLAEERSDGHAPPLASDEDLAAEELAVAASDCPDLMFIEHTPPPDPTKHRRKRAAQWQRWQNEVLPKLLPHFARLLQETKSLREMDSRRPQPSTCACPTQTHTIAVMRFAGFSFPIPIHGQAQNSLRRRFANCLMWYTHLRNLLKDHYGQTIETVRQAVVGPEVPTSPSPPRGRHARRGSGEPPAPSSGTPTMLKHRSHSTSSSSSSETPRPAPQTRNETVREPTSPSPPRGRQSDHSEAGSASSSPCPPRGRHAKRGSGAPPASSRGTLTPRQHQSHSTSSRCPPRGRHAKRGSGEPPASSLGTPTSRRHRSHSIRSSSSDTPRPAPQTRKRAREPTPEPGMPECPKVPFPEPPPRVRPSEYLRRRCPACFANLKRDDSQLVDVMVCLDACFTQKKKKTPPDPPKRHPHTHFVPEEQTRRMEEYVESVRAAKEHGGKNDKRRKRATVQEVEDETEDGYEFERLPLPRSVLDGCEASFKAADEKWEKASTEFFEDTALMGLLCRHDRVLWVANMHSAGEKQFYVVALIETLFQHIPHDIRVGILYDVACAFERSCLKWNFLDRYIDRVAFAVSVFHAFGHEWPCQLLYHPRKRVGFGFTNGEGCERFWKSIQHLIAHLRICGYHNRLYILDAQIEHDDEASLFRLGEWISRRYRHSRSKRVEAMDALRESGKSKELLREQWHLQVESQTRPLPRRSKNKGQKAVDAIILGRAALTAHQESMEYTSARQALHKAERTLQRQEEALGVEENEELEMLVNNNKLIAHTEAAIKRREPTIAKLAAEYNKLCAKLGRLIKDGKAPRGAIAPIPIPAEGMWELDIDDAIFQEVGLDDRDDEGEPPLWLCDEKVRTGIKAMLELDRCDEEDARLQRENLALRVWLREEWEIATRAIEQADSDVDKYHLKLHQNKLGRLCATWDKCLPDFGAAMGPLPPWGPSAMQLSSCRVDAHRAARGEERHYGWLDDEDEDGEQSGGEDEDFGILDAVVRADIYRDDENGY